MMRCLLLGAMATAARAQGSYQGTPCADALSGMSDQLNEVSICFLVLPPSRPSLSCPLVGLLLTQRPLCTAQACCSPTSNCAGGFPVQCSSQCADLWLPFRRACRQYLDSQPALADLGRSCHTTRKVDSEPTDPQVCPNGYYQHGDNCYLLSLDRATYSTAMRACEALGGELACINDEAENSFITDLLTGDDDYWIGLNDRDVDNTFAWANKQCTSDYRNWMPGEPNNAANGLAGDPDCVRMCPSGTSAGYVAGQCGPGQWADYSCPSENHYICEIRGCPVGWIAHGGSCYAGFTSPPGSGGPGVAHVMDTWSVADQKPHEEASDACAALGATLVHIDDAAENAWIASMLPPLGTDDYWLGAMNQDTVGRNPESNLAWQGDEGSAAPDNGGYTNWFPGEPNNAGGGVNYDAGESACVRMCPFGKHTSTGGRCARLKSSLSLSTLTSIYAPLAAPATPLLLPWRHLPQPWAPETPAVLLWLLLLW